MPDAYARFGDKNDSRGIAGSYECTWGTSPGVAQLKTGPNFGKIGQVDKLTIYFRGNKINLHDALVVDPRSTFGVAAAPAIDFAAYDRRWKWQHAGRIYGDYNRERRDGSLEREANPRELALKLLVAMGEGRRVDVTALPTDPRPRTVWEAAHPTSELNRICTEFGCVVCFDPVQNRVYLAKIGVGQRPPNIPHISRGDALVVPSAPDGIRVVGGVAQFQTALALGEPVGREVDQSWQPIDQLSYAPTGGWQTKDPYEFVDLESEYTDPATGETLYHRDLATSSVWRVYRISGQASGGFAPPWLVGSPYAPKSILDLGPFSGSLLDKDPLTDERLPIYARGVFYAADDRLALDNRGNTKPNTRFPGSVRISSEQRLAIFDRPLFKYGAGDKPEPADVVLIASYGVTSDGVPVRWEESRAALGKTYGAGEHVEHHDEIIAEMIADSASYNGQARSNVPQIVQQMGYYLDALAEKFLLAEATNATYGGILTNLRLDGELRSIRWSWGGGAPTTECAWNCERSPYVIPWENRNEARNLRAAEYAIRRNEGIKRVAASRAAALAGT